MNMSLHWEICGNARQQCVLCLVYYVFLLLTDQFLQCLSADLVQP